MELYQKEYQNWINNPFLDEETKRELLSVSDEKEIEDRFYKELEFGTAGLRGIMGAGTNRMNRYTVGKATLGLGRWLLDRFPDAAERGVVIGYDTRNNSSRLAENVADILTALGIRTRLFDQCVPTPVLSYAVRHFRAVSGIVITASHNPPAYNGYKAYDESGCQLSPEASEEVLSFVSRIADWQEIPTQKNPALLEYVGDAVIDSFLSEVLTQSTVRDGDAKKNLKIVYTPIHGTGKKPVSMVLEKDGFTDVSYVEEQWEPNGDFPTVKSPNPEEQGALQMGLDLAQKTGADLVIGTDPDADRIGCAARKGNELVLLTGNQVGALLTDFLLKTKTVLGSDPTLITTIVTGELGASIARRRGCRVMHVLTGFKFIGDAINRFETMRKSGEAAPHFVLGYEESYGYLIGTHARDKDAVVAAMLIAEMAAYHKKNGRTLHDALEVLYREFGYYLDTVKSFTLQGKEGIETIAKIMETLREKGLVDVAVDTVKDYSIGIDNLPKSNVLKFFLSDGSCLSARPSGTEPKIKFYYSIRAEGEEAANQKLQHLQAIVSQVTGL